MFLLTLFEPRKVKQEKAHVKNLIALANVDGVLAHSELNLIFKFAEARGLRKEEVEALLEEPYNSDFKIPASDTERFNQIFELIEVMLADGKVEDSEVDFCITIAQKLGFSKAFAGVVVNKIAMGISNDLEKEAIRSEMESFLSF